MPLYVGPRRFRSSASAVGRRRRQLRAHSEGGHSVGRKTKSLAAALAVVAVVVSCATGVAFAASNHGISGTVYSGCSGSGPWFTSSTPRTKAGTGLIKAQFSEINDGGLTFKL